MFANCSLGGQAFGFPDVCLTPTPVGPVPVPYPNTAMLPMALPPTTSLTTLICMMPAHNMVTTIPMSLGDNAGAAGGVMSGMMMGPARSTLGSTKVIMGGTPATRWLSPTLQNLTNCPAGATLAPSQTKVLIASLTRKAPPMPETTEIKIHVPQDLDYVYRDVVGIYVGAGDVLLEFGNIHRSTPGHASIGDRIVLTLTNAYDLHKRLGLALQQAQARLQEQARKASE